MALACRLQCVTLTLVERREDPKRHDKAQESLISKGIKGIMKKQDTKED